MNIPLLVGVGILMFSIYMLKFALTNFKKARASESWPAVSGQLTQVRLWGKRNIQGDMIDANHLSVTYQYQVKEQSLSGVRVAYFTLVYPQTRNFANSHPPQSHVQVYYDPKDPAESVLLTGVKPNKPYSELTLAGLGAIVGLALSTASWLGLLA